MAKHRALDFAASKIISFEDKYTFNKYKKDSTIVSINGEEEADIKVLDGVLIDRNEVVADLSGCNELLGKHNHQNASFAYAVCKHLGVPRPEIARHMLTFTALPHRINIVRKINNILFVNDSKATNPESAAAALATFVGYKIFWIVGGRSKNIDPRPVVDPHLGGVFKIYAYGESRTEFHKVFLKKKPVKLFKDMFRAINCAYNEARDEISPVVILLSPMCSSFDQFENFEHRGREFCRAVMDIK
jgi:UDP-N-acetylmuramoylalanine--D-glutamate ligase